MAILPILQYPDARLAQKGKTVEMFDAALHAIIDDMFDTHYQTENCAALAATQLGIPYRMTVIDFSEERNQPLCLINPEIITSHGKETSEEGCMSVQDITQKVTRAKSISIRYHDKHGELQTLEADGFLAKCIQHEIDHLNGILFIDRLTPVRRILIEPKLKSLAKKK
jgi:peptide deformylase